MTGLHLVISLLALAEALIKQRETLGIVTEIFRLAFAPTELEKYRECDGGILSWRTNFALNIGDASGLPVFAR